MSNPGVICDTRRARRAGAPAPLAVYSPCRAFNRRSVTQLSRASGSIRTISSFARKRYWLDILKLTMRTGSSNAGQLLYRRTLGR